jgi:hypothetical protein
MTEKERRIKENLLEDLLKMIPLIIETEREFGKSEREIYKIVDAVLDRINELRRQLKKED